MRYLRNIHQAARWRLNFKPASLSEKRARSWSWTPVKDSKDSGEICPGGSISINWQLIGYKGFLISLQFTQLLCILSSRDAGGHSCRISDWFQQWLFQHFPTTYEVSAVLWCSENGNLGLPWRSLSSYLHVSPWLSPLGTEPFPVLWLFFFCMVLPPLKLARVISSGSTTTLSFCFNLVAHWDAAILLLFTLLQQTFGFGSGVLL